MKTENDEATVYEPETEKQANTANIAEIDTAIKANEHANYMLLINKKRLEKANKEIDQVIAKMNENGKD